MGVHFEEVVDEFRRLILLFLVSFTAVPNGSAIRSLTSLPVSASSEDHLSRFILSPPSNFSAVSSSTACDFLLVRFISSGRFLDAVRLSRKLDEIGENGVGTKIDEENLSLSPEEREIQKNLKKKLREKRKLMISGAILVLPQVEQELLRAELEFSNEDQGEEIEPLGMSWENVEDENGVSTPRKTEGRDNNPMVKGKNLERLPLSSSPSRSKSSSPAQVQRNSGTSSPASTSITNHETLLHAVLRASRATGTGSGAVGVGRTSPARSPARSSPLRSNNRTAGSPLPSKMRTSINPNESMKNTLVGQDEDTEMSESLGATVGENQAQAQSRPQSQVLPPPLPSTQPSQTPNIGFLAKNNLSMGTRISNSPTLSPARAPQPSKDISMGGDASFDSFRSSSVHIRQKSSGKTVPYQEFNSPLAAVGRPGKTLNQFKTSEKVPSSSSSSSLAPPVRRYEPKYSAAPASTSRNRKVDSTTSIGDFSIGDGLERMESEYAGEEDQEPFPWSAEAHERSSRSRNNTQEENLERARPRPKRRAAASANSTPAKSRSTTRTTRTAKSSAPLPEATSTPTARRTRSKESARTTRSTSSVPGGFPGLDVVENELDKGEGEGEVEDQDQTMDELDLLGPSTSGIKKSRSNASTSTTRTKSRLSKSVTPSSSGNFTIQIPATERGSKPSRKRTTSRSKKNLEKEDDDDVGSVTGSEISQDEEVEIPRRRGGSRKPVATTSSTPKSPRVTKARGTASTGLKRSARSGSEISVSDNQDEDEEVQNVTVTPRRKSKASTSTATARSRSRRNLELSETGEAEEGDGIDKTPGVKTRSGKRTMG